MVVWQSFGQDGDDDGIFGRRFERIGLVPTPTLSLAGIAVGVIGLLGAGAAALRRRRRGKKFPEA